MNKGGPIPEFNHFTILSRVSIDENGCWNCSLTRQIRKSGERTYPVFTIKKKKYFAHRAMYQLFVGNLEYGMVIDHTCMNKKCVNPDHLRQVDYRTNVIENNNSVFSVNARKTHCKWGHEFNESNTKIAKNGDRSCRTCAVAISRRTNDKLLAIRRAKRGLL